MFSFLICCAAVRYTGFAPAEGTKRQTETITCVDVWLVFVWLFGLHSFLLTCHVCDVTASETVTRWMNVPDAAFGFWKSRVCRRVRNSFERSTCSEITTAKEKHTHTRSTSTLTFRIGLRSTKRERRLVSGWRWDGGTSLLCQACVLGHAVEDSFPWHEVCRSVELCDLSLV